MSQQPDDISSALPPDLAAVPRLEGFRLRGLDMTRLESFVDAAFAFAVTMLVIAGQEVPDDVTALLNAFKDVPAFAASIGMLAIFWRGHWLWSRRHGRLKSSPFLHCHVERSETSLTFPSHASRC